MKYVLLACIVTFFLTACSHSNDGWTSTAIAYQTETGIGHIAITDSFSNNGIYMDEANKRIYCQEGPDITVALPAETQWNVTFSHPGIRLEVEAVCSMGQGNFDKLLRLFQLVQEP